MTVAASFPAQVVAVVFRRAGVFHPRPGELATFPGRVFRRAAAQRRLVGLADAAITAANKAQGTAPESITPSDRRRSGNQVLAAIEARALARNLDRALDRARKLARDLDLARDLARYHDRDLDRALDGARDLARDLHLDLARARDHFVAPSEIDASGADLSRGDFSDLSLLESVIWTRETVWPPGITEQVERLSEQIAPGVYRVRGGSERDQNSLIF